MQWKLELVVVPVSDIDRAKTFYIDKTGFNLDVDYRAGDEFSCRAADTVRLGMLDRPHAEHASGWLVHEVRRTDT